MSHELVELSRKLANLIRFGSVVEVYHATARCRVASGGILTGWLPWITSRAGDTRDWDPPTIGEQVMLLAPSGELASAIVITGLYSNLNAAPENSPDLHQRVYPDGAVISYDHANHDCTVDLPAGATLTINASGGITILGDITVTGDVIADGISLKTHVHGGVVSGGGTTGAPQ